MFRDCANVVPFSSCRELRPTQSVVGGFRHCGTGVDHDCAHGCTAASASGCLELLTRSVWEPAPGDEAAGQGQEASVDVGAALPALGQASELVQQGEGLLDDPAHGLVVVPSATAADQGLNPSVPQHTSVLVVVVTPIGDDDLRSPARAAPAPSDGRNRVDERDELGDVVAVTAGQCRGERDAASFADQVVFRAGLCPVDGARPGRGSPLSLGCGRRPHTRVTSRSVRLR